MWDGGGGAGNTEFTNPDNWVGNTVPPSGDDAEVSGNYTVTYTAATDFNDLSSVVFGDSATSPVGSPSVSGGDVEFTDVAVELRGESSFSAINVADVGDVTLAYDKNQINAATFGLFDNAIMNVAGNLVVGDSKSSTNILTLDSGGALTVDGNLYINGDSIVNQKQGIASIGGSMEFADDGSTFTQTAGQLFVGVDIDVFKGSGTNSGSVSIDGELRIHSGSWTNSGVNASMSIAMNLEIKAGGSYDLGGGGGGGGTLSVGGTIDNTKNGNFNWNAQGTLEAYTLGGVIDVDGDLTASAGAILNLNHKDEYLDVSGTFTADGLIIDGYDFMFDDLRLPTTVIDSTLLISADPFVVLADITFNFTQTGSNVPTFYNNPSPYATYLPGPDADEYWFAINEAGELRAHWQLQPIPEPHTSLLLALGSAALLLRRRR